MALELIDRFSLTRWLADDRLMDYKEPADLEWSLEVFVPRLAKSQLLRMARLPSYSEQNCEMVEVVIDKGHTCDLKMVVGVFRRSRRQ